MIELSIAFAGGGLALLSPCSALLLPSFFAYAFASPGKLMLRTMIFYAGLLAVFVPLGLGAGALGAVVRENLGPVTAIAGALLILLGIYQLVAGGFALPGTAGLAAKAGGAESATATFVLGMVSGVGGFCSGPILAGILTLAATSGNPLSGALLLAAFALGMVLPLLALAAVWDRLGARRVSAIRRRTLRIGPIERHWSTVISSVIFIVLGATFIIFRGSNALSGFYERAGAPDLVFRLEEWISGNGAFIATVVALVAVTAIGRWAIRRGSARGARADRSSSTR